MCESWTVGRSPVSPRRLEIGGAKQPTLWRAHSMMCDEHVRQGQMITDRPAINVLLARRSQSSFGSLRGGIGADS